MENFLAILKQEKYKRNVDLFRDYIPLKILLDYFIFRDSGQSA